MATLPTDDPGDEERVPDRPSDPPPHDRVEDDAGDRWDGLLDESDEDDGDEDNDDQASSIRALVVSDVSPFLLTLLMSLPDALELDKRPEVQSRLYPDPTDDQDANAEWQRMVRPDLMHLVASAREVVERDLHALALSAATESDDGEKPRLVVPESHRDAWISALQTARLALAVHHDLMEQAPLVDHRRTLADEPQRLLAAVAMDAYAGLLEALVESALDDLPQIDDDPGDGPSITVDDVPEEPDSS